MYVMKKFFHPKVPNLNEEFRKFEKKGTLESKDMKRFLEIAYDYADDLFDRRFEDLKSRGSSSSKTCGEPEKSKVQELYQHLSNTQNTYQSYCESNKDTDRDQALDILYHLTIGNICMRIEQWHLDNYHYELAEQWYGMATGALWQGMNKVQSLNDFPTDNALLIYHLLLMLNIGKCSRNYANQNRRSDFIIARDKFQQIQECIEKHLKKIGEINRQLALIGADASINIARINRHMYKIALARKEFFCILTSFSAIRVEGISVCKANKKVTIQVLSGNESNGQYETTFEDTADTVTTDEDFRCTPETIQNIFKSIEKEDQESIILQMLIEFGLLLRKSRNYIEAVNTFMAADVYDPEQNIDAINNISSALRQLIATSDTKSDSIRDLVKRIQNIVFKDGKETLMNQLKTYAVQGNLYALREYVKWHCDCIGPKHKKMSGWAQEVGITSTQPQNVLNSLGKTLNEVVTKDNHSYENTDRNTYDYNMADIIEAITLVIKVNLSKSKLYSNQNNVENVRLLYLRGCVELQFHYYDQAIKTFEEICSRKEAEYIRRGTLGLKSRYQLAQCYISKTEFRKAMKILQEIRDTLQSSLAGRDKSASTDANSDATPDFRVDRDYGYCLMQLGSYQEACSIYQEIYNKKKYMNYSQHQQIMSLNNYASCLIHINKVDEVKEVLEEASKLDEKDRITNLLWGYYYVCQSDRINAQTYFDKSYGQDYDLNPDFYWNAKLYAHPDRAEEQNMVERRSAYIINLTNICDDPASNDLKWHNKIVSFLSDISPACVLSLNATIALAKWLCKWEDGEVSPGKKQSGKPSNHLYRSFAAISVCHEHGARAFMEFKTDSNFRYFKSDERGRILARLFVMYRYIKMIKEKLSCSKSGSSCEGTPPLHLVHYTNLETLKILLSEKSPDSILPPCFRVSNCGYMNDVFEGSVFLDKMRNSVVSSTNSNSDCELKEWNKMVGKYFPHLGRSEENMIPVGRNVYIASLSLKPDSFPLWSIYAKNETGCNIEFSENFFDIFETSKNPEKLQDYLISKYTDDDYPVYLIKYLGTDDSGSKLDLPLQCDGKSEDVLQAIYAEWKKVDEEVDTLQKNYSGMEGKIEDDMLKSGINAIYTFASDRINEVRFLFKDADYQYEKEARVVVTASTQSKIDETMSPPRAYAKVDRTIDNISVRLGSKIDDATVDQLVTWLKLTGKVREVKLSKRNRRTVDTGHECETSGSIQEA